MAHAMGKPGWGDLGLWWACAQVKLGREPCHMASLSIQGLRRGDFSNSRLAAEAIKLWRSNGLLGSVARRHAKI